MILIVPQMIAMNVNLIVHRVGARALPDYKGDTELEKIRMEGFWEAVDWCEEHYKWMEEHWEKLDDYTALIIEILEDCYADGRAPTAEEMTQVDNFWNED